MFWIIYKHTNKINQKVYIGQTCQKVKDRWRNGEGYKGSTKFYNAIKKYGWDNFEHEIIEDNIDSREKADSLEKYWIKYYDSINNGYNMHPGGSGFKSEDALKYNKQNWENGTFNKIFCKKVICLNNNTIYDSLAEASEKTGVHKDGISNCCRHVVKSAGKDEFNNPLLWEFYEEGKEYQYIKPLYKNTQKVICITTNEIFNSIQEGCNKYNISHTGISNCCNGKQKTSGQLPDGTRLVWRYYQENNNYKIENNISGKSNKQVICLETNKIYDSLVEAGKDVNVSPNNIGNCCRGKTKTSAGYHWKFYKDLILENERGKKDV